MGSNVFILLVLLQAASVSSSASKPGFDKVRAVSLGGWLVIERWIKPSLFDGISNSDLLDGTEIQLKSLHLQRYVCAENGGGGNITVSRTWATSWETFKLWRVTSTDFQLRVVNTQFMSVNKDGVVNANNDAPGTQETFTIVRNRKSPNRIYLKSSSGMYLQAKNYTQLTADYNKVPDWEDNNNPAVFELYFSTSPANSLGGDYQLANGYGPFKAAKVLKEHRDSFVTEEDFSFLQRSHINTVRIPVGWWIAYDPHPPHPFIAGSLQALDNAFSWSAKYNIGVIIDLHAAPGSQNRWEHSGTRDGVPMWTHHIRDTLKVIDFLVTRYSNHSALFGVELLNEPNADDIPLNVVSDYYKQGYQVVRKYSGAYVIMCQRIGSDPSELVNLMRQEEGYTDVVLDIHLYNLFTSIFDDKSVQWNLDFIKVNKTQQIQALNNAGGASIFVGEWTNEWNITNASDKNYQSFGDTQLSVYGNASFGWSYWALRNQNLHWDFKRSIKRGFLRRGSDGNWP